MNDLTPVPPQLVQPGKQPPTQSKLTVVCAVYHQVKGGKPIGRNIRFAKHLVTDDVPYSRPVKVGQPWQKLNTGWVVGKCSRLIVEASDKPVFLTFTDPTTLGVRSQIEVLTKEDAQFRPHTLDIWLRSSEPTVCTVTLIPE